MSKKEVKKKEKNEISFNFKKAVVELESNLINNADGENIIVGTKEKPIVTDSNKFPIEHFFMDGVYIRKMTMFKGSAVVGAIHKHLHMCFLQSGHLSVADENGVKEYIAPCHVIATPGIKRVLYAHEDSIWYNTHKNPSNIEDVVKLEKEIVALNYEEYEKYVNKK